MKNKTIILALLLIVMSAPVIASELIADETIFEGSTIKIEDDFFTLDVDPAGSKLSLRSDFDAYFIYPDRCTEQGILKVCAYALTYDEERDQYKARVKAYHNIATATIEREFTKENVFLFEPLTVTTTITNTGDTDADNILFTDDFPTSIKVESASGKGCTYGAHTVRYQGSIAKGDSRICTYELLPSEKVIFDSVAKIKYFNGYEMIETFSSTKKLTVKNPFDITTIVPKERLESGEESFFNVTFENLEDQELDVRFEIHFPENLKILTFGGGLKKSTGYKLINDEVFSPGELEDYHITFETLHTGPAQVKLVYEYEKDKELVHREEFIDYDVNVTGLISSTNLEDNIESGTSYKVRAWIENPNEHTDFYDITVYYNGTLGYFPTYRQTLLQADSFAQILDIELPMPKTAGNKVYSFSAIVSYRDGFGVPYITKISESVNVIAPKKVSIKHTIDEERMTAGNNTKILVEVTNNRNIDLEDVNITDKVIGMIIKGMPGVVLDIVSDQTKIAYTYYVVAPFVEELTSYDVQTIIEYEYDGELFTETKKSKIVVYEDPNYNYSIIPTTSLKITRDIDEELEQGKIYQVPYTLENEGDQTAKGVRLDYALGRFYDVIGPTTRIIGDLGGRSQIIIEGERVRFKQIGDFTINYSSANYKLEYVGYSNETSLDAVTVEKGKLDGPAILLTKKVTKTSPNAYEVFIIVQNIGRDSANVELFDVGKSWNITMFSNAQKTVSFKVSTPLAQLIAKPAIASYYYRDEVYTTASNSVTINNTSGDVISQNLDEGKAIVDLGEETGRENTTTVGFFERIKNFFSNIFS